MEHAPLSLVVDDKLEDTMPIRHAERNRVLAGLARYGGQRRADVRVEHRELELEVVDARVRLEGSRLRVVLRDFGSEDLCKGLTNRSRNKCKNSRCCR